MTTENRSWMKLLPANGGIGVCPQIGRVKIPPACIRKTLHLTNGRQIKGVTACWFENDSIRTLTLVPATGRLRKELESLKGCETIEFIGRPCEWNDMNGTISYVVIVTDMNIIVSEARAFSK